MKSGKRGVRVTSLQLFADLPLVPDAASLLQGIGLPTGPPAALALCLRVENVNIIHRPTALHLLTATDLEIGRMASTAVAVSRP